MAVYNILFHKYHISIDNGNTDDALKMLRFVFVLSMDYYLILIV